MYNFMVSGNKLEEIIKKTSELVLSTDDPKDLTTRKIAENVNINPAMVNYYFGSKDELLRMAVSASSIKADFSDHIENPRKIMLDTLMSIHEKTTQYSKYGLNGDAGMIVKDAVDDATGLLKAIDLFHEGKVSREQCKLAAFRLVSFTKMMALSPDVFTDYVGTGEINNNSIKKLISSQLDLVLGSSL